MCEFHTVRSKPDNLRPRQLEFVLILNNIDTRNKYFFKINITFIIERRHAEKCLNEPIPYTSTALMNQRAAYTHNYKEYILLCGENFIQVACSMTSSQENELI